MKKLQQKIISTSLAITVLCTYVPCFAETSEENSTPSNDIQMIYSEDVLTLNAYYDAETSRIFSEMCITYTGNMPEIYCSYDNDNFVLTEASDENRYSFVPKADANEIYVKAVQILADGSKLDSDIKTVNVSEAVIAAYSDNDDCLGYIRDMHTAEPIAVLPIGYIPGGFSEMMYMYPSGSYFSQTGSECTCHGASKNCNFYGGCDCISYEDSIQCMAFAKMAYHLTHNRKLGSLTSYNGSWNGTSAKSLLLDTKNHNLGIYLRVKANGIDHSIAVINTTANNLTVYHANYGGRCLVKYETYTWDNFAKTFYLTSYAK